MSVLERVPLDEIRDRAATVQFRRTLLALFVGVFWALGWLARRTFLGLAYVGTAVKVGWQDAGPQPARPRR